MSGERNARIESSAELKAMRRNVGLAVMVQVLVEEETFSPFAFMGTCQDISRTGALIIVRDLTRESYVKMIQRPRYVRTACQLPGVEQPVTLFGRLVGYDYKAEAASSVCRLAIAFEPMKNEVVAALDRFLASLPAPKAGESQVSARG